MGTAAGAHELETLVVRIVGDMRHYSKTLDDVTRDANAAAGKIAAAVGKIGTTASGMASAVSNALAQVGKSMRGIGVAASFGISAPLIGAGLAATKLAADLEATTMQFRTMLGRDQGDKMLANLREFSRVTPFRFGDVAGSAKTLMAFGTATGDVLPTLQMLGDIAAGTGGDFQSLATVFGQIQAMGRLQGQDFLQLVNTAPPVVKALSDMYGGTNKLKAAMEGGRVPFADVLAAMKSITGAGGQMSGMMLALSKTTKGAFSNLADDFTQMAEAFGMELLPMAREAIQWMSGLVQVFKELPPETKRMIIMAGALVAALGPLLWVAGALASVMAFAASVTGLWTAAALGAASVALALADTLGITQTGFGELFNSIRINGTGLGTWLAGFAIEARRTWNDLTFALGYSWRLVWNGITAIYHAAAGNILLGFKHLIDELLNINNKLPESLRIDMGFGLEDVSRGLGNMAASHDAAIMQDARKLNTVLHDWAKQDDALMARSKKIFSDDPQDATRGIVLDTERAKRALGEIGGNLANGLRTVLGDLSGLLPKAPAMPDMPDMPAAPKAPAALDKATPKDTEFRQIALARVSVAGLAARGQKVQDVRAGGVESRLDRLIEVTSRQAVLS